MRTVLIVILLVALVPLTAEASCALSSVRLGHELIKTGDPERRVIEAEPDRRVRLETRFGGAAGYRYEFYRRDMTIQIYARDGVVFRVCRIRG